MGIDELGLNQSFDRDSNISFPMFDAIHKHRNCRFPFDLKTK